MKTLSLFSLAALISIGGVAMAGDPKPADKAPPPAKTAAAPAMPTPPTQIAEMGKTVNGTWKCKGTASDSGKSSAMEATVKTSTDAWWITDSLDAKSDKMAFKMQSFTTFDAQSKKWRRVSVDSYGGYMVGTSDGMGKDNKMAWNMDSQGPMGASMFKEEVDASDAKKGVKMSGKMSMDKGKNWLPVYEMTCTK